MATALVYGPTSGIIRRIIYTDDTTTLPDHCGPNERILSVSAAILVPDQNGNLIPSIDLAYKALTAATGIQPRTSHCMVIDQNGDVVNVIEADVELDTLPGYSLWPFEDGQGGIGWVPNPTGDGSFIMPPGQSVDNPDPPASS